jgi:hypothetical protein
MSAMPACWLIPTMTLSPARLARGGSPCRTKTPVNRRSNVYPKKQSVVLLDWNNSDDALLGKTRKRLRISTHGNWSACEINGETIALELERRRNAAGGLVQNLRARFVPPEPPNRTSLVHSDRYEGLGAIACGESSGRLANPPGARLFNVPGELPVGQYRTRCHGTGGNDGNNGTLVSITYVFSMLYQGSTPAASTIT